MSQNLDHMRREVLSQVNSNTTNEIPFLFATLVTPTSVELVYDSLQPFLKGDGISRTLERKAKLPVLYSPVMEDGVHLVVH